MERELKPPSFFYSSAERWVLNEEEGELTEENKPEPNFGFVVLKEDE